MEIAFFFSFLVVIRYQISRAQPPRRARENLNILYDLNLTSQGVVRLDTASHPMAMNETFRGGVSGFREMVLEFEFLGNTGAQ